MSAYKEKLEKQLKAKGTKKGWLAKALKMPYPKFWKKLRENEFTQDEKNRIKVLIGEDTEEKLQMMASARTKAALYIASKQA